MQRPGRRNVRVGTVVHVVPSTFRDPERQGQLDLTTLEPGHPARVPAATGTQRLRVGDAICGALQFRCVHLWRGEARSHAGAGLGREGCPPQAGGGCRPQASKGRQGGEARGQSARASSEKTEVLQQLSTRQSKCETLTAFHRETDYFITAVRLISLPQPPRRQRLR